MQSISPTSRETEAFVDDWLNKLALDKGKKRKAMASMIMLVSWVVWKERNARVFRHHYFTGVTTV
jgi:hypothetical protein